MSGTSGGSRLYPLEAPHASPRPIIKINEKSKRFSNGLLCFREFSVNPGLFSHSHGTQMAIAIIGEALTDLTPARR